MNSRLALSIILIGVVSHAFASELDSLEMRLNVLGRQVSDLSLPYAQRGLEGRLAQARIRFEQGQYAETLAVLGPILKRPLALTPKQEQDIWTMAAHCSFEANSYLEAQKYFRKLTDQTSLYRLVQIADRLDLFKDMQTAYGKIDNPPPFVRYIYARQVFINKEDTQAQSELKQILKDVEYGEKASYILGASLARMGDLPAARQIFKSLENSKNLELGNLAKLALARTFYESDMPKQAIDIYEDLNAPDELAQAQIRAGDLSENKHDAQKLYHRAEKNAVDKNLLNNALIRQDKINESRIISAQVLAEVNNLKQMLAEKNLVALDAPWVAQQPEMQRLQITYERIKSMEKQISELEIAYDAFDVDSVEQLKSNSALLGRLSEELLAIREQLTKLAASEIKINFGSDTKIPYAIKSTRFELDGAPLQNLALRNVEAGEHELKVSVLYRLASGDVQSMVDYRLSRSYHVKVGVGEHVQMDLTFRSKPDLALKVGVQAIDLSRLQKLQEQASLIGSKLVLDRAEEPFKLKEALAQAAGELESLRLSWLKLSQDYEQTRSEIFALSQAKWIAMLNESIQDKNEALIHSGFRKRQSLQNRLSQIEQAKAAELQNISEGERQ